MVGIFTKTGILLLVAEQRFRAEGYSAHDAMIEARRTPPPSHSYDRAQHHRRHDSAGACSGRRVPMLQALAIAVIGGVLTSMILSQVVTPGVHYYFIRKTV